MIQAEHPSKASHGARNGLISVDEYHRMIESGEVTEEDRVELLEGRLIRKMSRNPPHDGTIHVILKIVSKLLPEPFEMRIQSALTTLDSEPEPDLAIVKGHPRQFLSRHPEPRDIAVVIEIANTSLRRDRKLKGRVYARGGVPFYWLVNLVANRIEVYHEPDSTSAEPHYRQRTDYDVNDAVPLVLEGREIAKIPVRDLLP